MAIDRGRVLQSAQLFASKGQFDAAINEWKKLSTESPGDGSIFNSIGELHLKRQATNDAVAAFMQAANAFRAEGATLKAIATFKKILKLDPSRYDVFRHLGDLNAERGLLSSAVQDYLTLGKHYLKAGKSKDALEIYKKIVSQDPSNLDAQQRVAELCLQENRHDEATTVYLQLGRERSAQQRHAEAKDAYQAVLRIDPANSEAIQFIEHFKKTGGSSSPAAKPESSMPRAGSAGRPPKNAEPLNLLSEATRRIEDKQFAGAEAILNQMLTKEPGNPEVCQLLAKLHLQRGDLQVALGEYRYLAGAALRAQDYGNAESLIADFLAVEPQSVAMLELYGDLYGEKGDVDNAVLQYGKAIELLLEHPEPGMPTLHEELFEKVALLAPDSPTVKKLMALMQGTALEEPPGQAQSNPSEPLTAAIPSSPTQVETFSTVNAAPDDLPDRYVSPAAPEPLQAQSNPSEPLTAAIPSSPTQVETFSTVNAAPDDLPDRYVSPAAPEPLQAQSNPSEPLTAAIPSSPTQVETFSTVNAAPDDPQDRYVSPAAPEPLQAQSNPSEPLTAAIPSSPSQVETFSTVNAAPDDPQDRFVSRVAPEPLQAQSASSHFAEPEPVTLSSGFSLSNAEPDEPREALSQAAGSDASLSVSEQFQAYVKAGRQAEAEEWLSRWITTQPEHAEARKLFGSLLEAKGDTAGAAVQYSHALELLLVHPNDASATQTPSLYAKVKDLAPASPLVAKWASLFSPTPQALVPAAETPVSAPPGNEIDPETHYTLGVAYKNMGLLEEAKEEFSCSMMSHDFFSDSCLMLAVCLKEQGACQPASAQLELLLQDPKCQGVKAQAIRYELGLLYEVQELWSQATAIYESIPTFHDVPLRLESIRTRRALAEPSMAVRYRNSQTAEKVRECP